MRTRIALLVLSVIFAAALATFQAAYAARPPPHADPFITAVRTGGRGDGTIHYTVDNTQGALPINFFRADINAPDTFKVIVGSPPGWTAVAVTNMQGKFFRINWSTSANPVAAGSTLSGFDAKVSGNAPFIFEWTLTDTSGGTTTGSLTVA